MKPIRLFATLFLALAVLLAQTGSVFAAPAFQTATVTDLACGPDGTTVIVTYAENSVSHEVEVSLETAITLELIEAVKKCKEDALVDEFGDIDPASLVPVEEPQHPVGAMLAAFFEDFADYDAIMDAHEDGTGFGVIAQALWMTKNLEGGTQDDFLAILDAKKTGDYSYFEDLFKEGGTPANWGQFKKAMLSGEKKANLGQVMSDKEKPEKGKPDKEKPDKGNGNGNKP